MSGSDSHAPADNRAPADDRAAAFVDAYLADAAGAERGLDRVVTTSSGLDAAGILAVLGDRRLGPQVLEVMSDLMHPTESMYFDAIFGAFHGQVDIRAWLIPTMQEIAFIDFEPTSGTMMFDDGEGGTSVDEWQMVANLDGERRPLSRGVSVRRYRDGWITWNADVYDTAPFRRPPEAGAEDAGLPDAPHTPWDTAGPKPDIPLSAATLAWLERRDTTSATAGGSTASGLSHAEMHAISQHPSLGHDMEVFADLVHPTRAVYIDPLFGEVRGQEAIRAWLTDVMPKMGRMRFASVGPVLFNGDASVEEWVQMAVQPDGTEVPMFRGTSIRRYADGWLMYAADYFDSAPLADADLQQAAQRAGSRLTADDIARHRRI